MSDHYLSESGVFDNVERVSDRLGVSVIVSLGRARLTIGELLRLERDAVLELDRGAHEIVELCVGEKVFARALLEEVEEENGVKFVARVIEIVCSNDCA